jgi:hypothetical protein
MHIFIIYCFYFKEHWSSSRCKVSVICSFNGKKDLMHCIGEDFNLHEIAFGCETYFSSKSLNYIIITSQHKLYGLDSS